MLPGGRDEHYVIMILDVRDDHYMTVLPGGRDEHQLAMTMMTLSNINAGLISDDTRWTG